MPRVITSIALAGVLSLAAGAAVAQPSMSGRSPHGPGPGMMGGHGWGFADPAAYLESLKLVLGITAAQQPAWDEYAAAVKGAGDQMQGAHRTMFDAMGTATWQERRDMMNRMFEVRQESFDKVQGAANKLLPTLDASQQAKAATRLPGLVGPGPGMMMGGRMGMMGQPRQP